MPLILGTNSIKDTGYDVANSCRFNDGDSAFLSKTQGTATSKKTFSISVWVKRANLSAQQQIFETWLDNNNRTDMQFTASDKILLQQTLSGSTSINIETSRLFRDVSAFYHILAVFDTTESTASDRVKLYINGVQETSFSPATYPSLNADLALGTSSYTNFIGKYSSSGGNYFDGYMAEYVFTDGTALSNTDVGEFSEDSPNIWMPKDVSGLTFGNNGFYLDFEDSSNLGNDANGGTDFTESGLAATDQATDTPTNNFAVMNPLANKIAASTFSEGNLKIAHSSAKGGNLSTIGFSTGKWYAEMKIVGIPTDERWHWGILPHDCHVADDPVNTGNDGIMLSAFNATIYANTGSGHAIINTFYGEDQTRFDSFSGILGLALDATSGTKTIAISKAGAWITGSDATDTDFSNALKVDISTAFARYPHWHIATGTGTTGANGVYSLNFGSPEISITSGNADANGYGNFEYPVPSGYYALCTKNLAEYG